MEAKVLYIELKEEEVVIKKEDYKKFRIYLNEGFYVFDRQNGRYILKKKPKVLVTVEYQGNHKTIDLRNELISHYGKSDIRKLIGRFKNDLKTNKIMLKSDSKESFSIVNI